MISKICKEDQYLWKTSIISIISNVYFTLIFKKKIQQTERLDYENIIAYQNFSNEFKSIELMDTWRGNSVIQK